MDRRQAGRRTGWEIRLRADSPAVAKQWARSLKAVGLEPGTAYPRGLITILPVYGKLQVEQFLKAVRPRIRGEVPELPARTDMRRSRKGRKSSAKRGEKSSAKKGEKPPADSKRTR
jgi:hypothetical protein